MNKILITTAALMFAAGAYAQGLINFNFKAGTSTTTAAGAVWSPVFLAEPSDSVLAKSGNVSFGIPPGATTYGGGFVIGSGFTAALFGGALGTADQDLVLVASTTFRTQTATTVAGTIAPPTTAPAVSGVAAGANARLQIRAWDNRGGTVTSWNQVTLAQNDSTVLRGVSPSFDSLKLGDGAANPVPNLQGLQSFNLHLVPEPSAIALGVLGLGALVMFRRRK